MEAKINIAAILKDKPQGTKLYDLLYNIDVKLDTISTTDTETVVWCTNETDNNTTCHRGYSEFGTIRKCNNGLQILLPSKEMRDWNKFSWKKGDVLVNSNRDVHIIFEGFDNDTYTRFKGKHYLWKEGDQEDYNKEETKMLTSVFVKVNDDAVKCYINAIEKRLGGKLNRETLEIEPSKPEFKDGDILSNPSTAHLKNHIFIFSKFDKNKDFEYHVALVASGEIVVPTSHGVWCRKDSGVRYATEEEKQQLFDGLANKGKAWDAEKKQIVDIKKEPQFKPFEKVLVRDSYDDMWRACLFSHIKEDDGRYVTTCFTWKFCIPYIGNEHLLGTTKDVEG